jgi:hypothetical protein
MLEALLCANTEDGFCCGVVAPFAPKEVSVVEVLL